MRKFIRQHRNFILIAIAVVFFGLIPATVFWIALISASQIVIGFNTLPGKYLDQYVKFASVIGPFVNIVGFLFVGWQLRIGIIKWREEVYLTLVTKASETNKYVFEQEGRQRVVDLFFGHELLPGQAETTSYWDTRLAHLNHVNYLELKWAQEGSPDDFQGIDANWQAFGRLLVSHLNGSATDSMPPEYRRACCDLWRELHGPMPSPTRYVKWLDKIERDLLG